MSTKNNRIRFHEYLLSVLGSNVNLYFQPPENLQIKYPAVVYTRNNIRNTFADDIVYLQGTEYQLTVIDKDPDSEIVDKISKLPTCRYSRHYTTSQLNHDVFIVTYE